MCIRDSITPVPINLTLTPRNQTQHRQQLRLNHKCDIEPVDCIIHSQGTSSAGPQEHEFGLEAGGGAVAVVEDDLGEELWQVVSWHRVDGVKRDGD